MRLRKYGSSLRIRFDLLQGAVALQEAAVTVRLFQVSLMRVNPTVIASEAKQSNRATKRKMDCFVAMLRADVDGQVRFERFRSYTLFTCRH